MKVSFQIGNDPITYEIKVDVDHPPSKDLRTPKEKYRQQVKQK